jgi:hypothetical protein
MKIRFLPAIVVAIAFAAATGAQDAGSAPPAGQSSGTGYGGGYGQHGGRGGYGGMGMWSHGLMGTVTDVAADHYTIKTDAGDVYTVHFSSNTRIVKQGAGMRGPGGGMGMSGGMGMGGRMGGGRGNPPQEIKPSDIKAGDVVSAMGNIDASAKSVDATAIVQVDPERVKQIREMEANFGKTWLMGRVTAIDGTKVTLTGMVDNAPHTFVADESTLFRRHREPVTLADIQVGDMVRVDGAVKNGVFTATTVNVGGMMGGGMPTVPRNTPPQ